MSVITESQVRAQLGALAAYVDASQGEYGSDLYADCIQATEEEWETNTRLLLTPKTIAMLPMPEDEYDIEEPAINFHRVNKQTSPRFRVRFLPVRTITKVSFQLTASNTILEYPQDWIKADLRLGVISIVPMVSPGLAAGSAMGLTLFSSGAMGSDGWPHLIVCNYTAGYDAAATEGEVDPPRPQWPLKMQVKLNLAKDAAWRVAGTCRRDIPSSIALDGFNQSFMGTDKYLEDLHKEFAEFQAKYLRQERPIRMGVM